jgi:hypothetical protein
MAYPFPRFLRLAAGALTFAAHGAVLALAVLLDVAGVSPTAAQAAPVPVAAETMEDAIRRLAAADMSQRQIAAYVGCSRATVRRALGATF